jgi:hypothetical protein
MRFSKILFATFTGRRADLLLAFPVFQHHLGRKTMKKLAAMVAGGLLLCGGAGVATADSRASRCEEFRGKLTLDWATSCEEFNTIMRKERIFEDAFFLPSGAPAICLAGTMTDAMLGGRAVEAKSLSALTANSFAWGQCSASRAGCIYRGNGGDYFCRSRASARQGTGPDIPA